MLDYSVYLVTDDPSRYAGDWLENVLEAVEGGVTCVQYRDTESDAAERLRRARRLKDALAARHVPLVVNNEADLAAAVGAEGVHVGQGDLPPQRVRAIVGSDCEIGLSITSSADLARFLRPAAAAEDVRALVGALGIGPVFDARKTKADASDALGLAGFAALCRELVAAGASQARVAIGGIGPSNAAEVVAAGATGLAVVSAFSRGGDSRAAAQKLRAATPRDL